MAKLTKPATVAAARMRSGGREHLQALTRGLAAVAYLNRVGACTNSALAKRLGLKYSTAHRMLMVLTDLGLAQHDPICHQYVLAQGVRELAAGFHDLPLIDEQALPRMRIWARRHGLALILVTQAADTLIVRAATDGQRLPATERYIAGSLLPARGSSEAAVIRAFGRTENQGASAWRLRRQGFAKRVLEKQDEIHISVPLALTQDLTAALSIRCSRLLLIEREALQRWVTSLSTLAAQIAAARS